MGAVKPKSAMRRGASRGGSFGFMSLHIAEIAVEPSQGQGVESRACAFREHFAVQSEVRLFAGPGTLSLNAITVSINNNKIKGCSSSYNSPASSYPPPPQGAFYSIRKTDLLFDREHRNR